MIVRAEFHEAAVGVRAGRRPQRSSSCAQSFSRGARTTIRRLIYRLLTSMGLALSHRSYLTV